MARLPRIVIPGQPHHITQRGNRRQITFFEPIDYQTYLQCLRQACTMFDVKLWAYCLMTNHIHLIVVPPSKDSLVKAIGRTHEAYTRYINFKMGWKGFLWQGRFSSFAMDDVHSYRTFPYVELNPVRAKMTDNPEEYEWSSARVHMGLEENVYLDDVEQVTSQVDNWKQYLQDFMNQDNQDIQQHARTGRPLGSESFLKRMEQQLGIQLLPQKRGPKPKLK